MRRVILICVGVTAMVALLAGCDTPALGRHSYADPSNDRSPGTPFEVEILRTIIKVGLPSGISQKVKITVEVEDSVPFAEWGPAIHGMSITFREPGHDFEIWSDHDGVSLYDGSPPVCPVTRTHNPSLDRYTFSFELSCLGGTRAVAVANVKTFHVPTDPAADKAPNTKVVIPGPT